MNNNNLNWIANFIWGIADDVLRDVYVRGKYRDVILPMTVIRRLDAVLEPNKQAVLGMKKTLDSAGIANQDAALRQTAEQAFYNTSPFVTYAPALRHNSLSRILRLTLMAFRRTCRRFLISLSSVTKFQR
jgi:type I restriction-modification system DNA methylase subunit